MLNAFSFVNAGEEGKTDQGREEKLFARRVKIFQCG